MTEFIKKLPTVFQTPTEKKFFDATFDQVFSKKDSDVLAGYIGRRVPGKYDPINDFYIPETTKDRTWRQLEPALYTLNQNSEKSTVFFYDDFLNRLKSLGGDVSNEDRLTSSEFYSWSPPINVDMFVNYHNYFWVVGGLPIISIHGAQYADIIGRPSFVVPAYNSLPSFSLSTGMHIQLVDDLAHPAIYIVENIGKDVGIRLIDVSFDYSQTTGLDLTPWDGMITYANGQTIDNTQWDNLAWETKNKSFGSIYVTIQRGSVDNNIWSRTNRWYHIDTISKVMELTGTSFPVTSTRAVRHIIEFMADIELYNSGKYFKQNIDFGFTTNALGHALKVSEVMGMPLSTIESYALIKDANRVVFFNDDTPIAGTSYKVKDYIYRVVVVAGDLVSFVPETVVLNDEIVFLKSSTIIGTAVGKQTWYYRNSNWYLSQTNNIVAVTPPLFQLYDHNGVALNDENTYDGSTFSGNKLFSYTVNNDKGAYVDPILGIPVLYSSSLQSSDIIFSNNLYLDRYVYLTSRKSIDGYYFYKFIDSAMLYNNWTKSKLPSKQRVIDRYVVGYGTDTKFKLSVTPVNFNITGLTPDLKVYVNGTEIQSAYIDDIYGYVTLTINGKIYVDLGSYLTLLTDNTSPPVVVLSTYSKESLAEDATGYYEMPQQLEANPLQEDIGTVTGSELLSQFTSIIAGNRVVGTNIGYKDSLRDISTGQYIIQNKAPLLKAMFASSSADVDIIAAIRYSNDEYTKFKNRYINTALQLINQGFNPTQYHTNTILISQWVDEIIKIINVSKESSSAFLYSGMIFTGSPYLTETITVPPTRTVVLSSYVDLSDNNNALYLYTSTGTNHALVIDTDYDITTTNNVIELYINDTIPVGTILTCALYKGASTAYVPATPSKLGLHQSYAPRIVTDYSYAIPTDVIIGHDGSVTVAYNDYRDNLLLELEIRIYNLIKRKFRTEYQPPIVIQDVKPSYFTATDYSSAEILDICEQYLNKWAAKNRANYRTNDWATLSQDTAPADLWKLYNYRTAISGTGTALHLLGNWRGIYLDLYNTLHPETSPWEMLGFGNKPIWWTSQYGPGVINNNGDISWPDTATQMWQDIADGIIRHGNSALYNAAGAPQSIKKWAKPGLMARLPVDSNGNLKSIPALFNIPIANPYAPFSGFDNDWEFGDVSPVEFAWMCTSGYRYSIQEILYLTKPAVYGEYMWDTFNVGHISGNGYITDIYGTVLCTDNSQYVRLGNSDITDSWSRPVIANELVHAESSDGIVSVRYGYQQWISDRILSMGKSVTDVFGQHARTMGVNLANKIAGFTNKSTINLYLESVSSYTSSNSLAIPSNNFEIILHKSPVVDSYSYSGVIIRSLANGTFSVYGYDLLNSEFSVLNRVETQAVDITVGGVPATFKYYSVTDSYSEGDIVRYNGVYYSSDVSQSPAKFLDGRWTKLAALPTQGGLSVSYKPIAGTLVTKYQYGAVLRSVQEVFDLLIGWGDWLIKQGWEFDEVDPETNLLNDWLYAGKQFLFWANSNWNIDSVIQLSPGANKLTLTVDRGYPDDVEKSYNGVYSILDKNGISIHPTSTIVERAAQNITISPVNPEATGLYFANVNTAETEHILIIDNTTHFSDIVYSPLLRQRQERIRFNGQRSNNWFGKMESPGYLIMGDSLVPNYDTIVNSMRYYYDPNIILDDQNSEDLGRHLIGYENKAYLTNLEIDDDIQYLFYQGVIRQKGSIQSFDKLFRSSKVIGDSSVDIYEEWAIKEGSFGNIYDNVTTEFILNPEVGAGEVVVARLNYKPSDVGYVKEINILHGVTVYDSVPSIEISGPDAFVGDWTPFQPGNTYVQGKVVSYSPSHGNIGYYSSKLDQYYVDTFVPEHWELLLNTRTASAYAILGTDDKLLNIVITDGGEGYRSAPVVIINRADGLQSTDKVYSVWQGSVIRDDIVDNIIEIDIDDDKTWIHRPTTSLSSLKFPTVQLSSYNVPNAGYVHINDVDWLSFNIGSIFSAWATDALNPQINDTIWVANTPSQDWDVYKLSDLSLYKPVLEYGSPTRGNTLIDMYGNFVVQLSDNYPVSLSTAGISYTKIDLPGDTGSGWIRSEPGEGMTTPVLDIYGSIIGYGFPEEILTHWGLVKSDNNEILLITSIENNIRIVPSYYTNSTNAQTNLGNLLVLQEQYSGSVAKNNNYVVAFEPYAGTDYVNPGIYLDPDTTTEYYAYYIMSADGIKLTVEDMPEYAAINTLLLFKTSRWPTMVSETTLPTYLYPGDKVWIDNYSNNQWGVFNISAKPGIWDSVKWSEEVGNTWAGKYGWDMSGPITFTPHRLQEQLIDTSLFKRAEVFSSSHKLQVQLPVYDPFKGILPAAAEKNINYIALQDPARYNITDNPRLYTDTIFFAKNQIGQIWWDVSTVKYVYYEQPQALTGAETASDNLVYKRNNWGMLFPGSKITIYEWVESLVPPDKYTGSGTPKSLSTYTQTVENNQFTGTTQTYYYFWVSNTTTKPNLEYRDLSAYQIAKLLESPKSQRFAYYAPIQQNEINNSYMFYNVQDILVHKGNNISVHYKLSKDADNIHTQWSFIRDGDKSSKISNKHWDKMVDSLCGYTKMLPFSKDVNNSIIIAKDLPWDVYGWDVALYDSVTAGSSPVYGMILPVPDPALSSTEKYGLSFRPRQGMFKDLTSARKVFVQSVNKLLENIPARDININWDSTLSSNIYWEETMWFKDGYQDAKPVAVYSNLNDAYISLSAGTLVAGDVVEVENATVDGRFSWYAVTVVDQITGAINLIEVATENSAIKLKSEIYTTVNNYALVEELRELLFTLRNYVFVNDYEVYQNKLFFSMLAYIVAEQPQIDWLFKSSYIYIKENNVPLSTNGSYTTGLASNVVSYINDVKPYHTKVRDFSSNYSITTTSELGGSDVDGDIAYMNPVDILMTKTKVTFTPTDVTTSYSDPYNSLTGQAGPNDIANPPLQYVGISVADTISLMDTAYTVTLGAMDSSKIGYSTLFPYTFDLSSLEDTVSSIELPADVVGIKVNDQTLYHGFDYYTSFDNIARAYTVYFYKQPPVSAVIKAYITWDGGNVQFMTFNYHNNETAVGFATDGIVIRSVTKLPVTETTVGGTTTFTPITGSSPDTTIIQAIADIPPGTTSSWSEGAYAQKITDDITIINRTIKYKLIVTNTNTYAIREMDNLSGELSVNLPAPSMSMSVDNLDEITVFVDPSKYAATNILPSPSSSTPGVIWINGERIEYKEKTLLSPNTWILRLVRRGTHHTSATAHASGSVVYIEQGEVIPQTQTSVFDEAWNAVQTPPVPNLATPVVGTGGYSNITDVEDGGIWYAQTAEANHLKAGVYFSH